MGPKKDGTGRGQGRRGRGGGGRGRRVDLSQKATDERQRLFSECSDDQCSVCWNDIKVFSVGRCNHHICMECSTRMRVLCSQKECPICRADLPKVVFTIDRKSYEDVGDLVLPYDNRNAICFENDNVRRDYNKLLRHKCPYCEKEQPVLFNDFRRLSSHVKREHEMNYCDLCTDFLQVYPVKSSSFVQELLNQLDF